MHCNEVAALRSQLHGYYFKSVVTMRIIAELPHPEFKISILNMNHKFIVKIEQGNLEQTYKIAEADLLDGVNSVFELLDEEFLKTVSTRFHEMRKDFRGSYTRYNY